jgi:hypothetical protein
MAISEDTKCAEWFFGKDRLKSCISALEVRADQVGLIMGMAGDKLEALGRGHVVGRAVIVYE